MVKDLSLSSAAVASLVLLVVSTATTICVSAQDVITDLVVGYNHNCAFYTPSKRVRCWGYGKDGNLGYEDFGNKGLNALGNNLPYVKIIGDNEVLEISQIYAGGYSTCARFTNNHMKCFGQNEYGQLGYNNKTYYGQSANTMGDYLPLIDFGSGRTVKQFVTGTFHHCAQLSDDKVYCFGTNRYAQLATGKGASFNVGDDPNEVGDSLVAVDFGNVPTLLSLHSSPSADHTCAVFEGQKLKCWGRNDLGQLGYGNARNLGDQKNELGKKWKYVDLGKKRKLVQIVIGGYHTCVLLSDETVRCWGQNYFGELGLGNTKFVGKKPGTMGNALRAVDWGKKLKAEYLVQGNRFNCGLLNNDELKCYGDNNFGQLGQGDIKRRGDKPGTLGDDLAGIDIGVNMTDIKLIGAGESHMCVLLNDGKVKCWGRGDFGQLGLGNGAENRGDAAGEMGSNLPYVDI